MRLKPKPTNSHNLRWSLSRPCFWKSKACARVGCSVPAQAPAIGRQVSLRPTAQSSRPLFWLRWTTSSGWLRGAEIKPTTIRLPWVVVTVVVEGWRKLLPVLADTNCPAPARLITTSGVRDCQISSAVGSAIPKIRAATNRHFMPRATAAKSSGLAETFLVMVVWLQDAKRLLHGMRRHVEGFACHALTLGRRLGQSGRKRGLSWECWVGNV